METKKVIEIDCFGAVNSVKELKAQIDKLKDAWINAKVGTEQYDKITTKLIDDQKLLNDVMNVGKKNVSALSGSYDALVQEMSILKKQWRATNDEAKRADIGAQIKNINTQLKELDSSIGNEQRKVGSYEQALATLNKTFNSQKEELRALKLALEDLDPSSEAYVQAFERASEVTFELSERQELLRMSSSDVGVQLDNLTKISAGVSAGFSAYNAIMVLTGNENEDVQKSMQKLQAGIALVQGIKGLEGLTKTVKAYVNATNKWFDKGVQLIKSQKQQAQSIQANTVATEANTEAGNTNASALEGQAVGGNMVNTSMKGAAVSTTIFSGALRVLKTALISTGIGALAVGIGVLVSKLMELVKAGNKANKMALENGELLDEINNNKIKRSEEALDREMELMQAQGASEYELLQKKKGWYEEYYNYLNSVVALNTDKTGRLTKKEKENLSVTPKINLGNPNNTFGQLPLTIPVIIAQIKDMEESGNITMKGLRVSSDRTTKELIKNWDTVKEKGVTTWKQFNAVFELFKIMREEVADNFKWDPLQAQENQIKATLASIQKEAEDAGKTELQLENERYVKEKKAFEENNKDTQTITKAHWKRVKDIVSSATASITERLASANMTQLEQLEATYKKEETLLRKYGKSTAQLKAEYEGNKALILVQNTLKDINKADTTDINNINYQYDLKANAGTAKAKDLKKQLSAVYEVRKSSLEAEYNLYKSIYDNESYLYEDRYEAQQKYEAANEKLQQLNTEHTLKMVKARMDALKEEVDLIDKNTNQSINQTKNAYQLDVYGGVSTTDVASGIWSVFNGAGNNTIENRKAEMNAEYDILEAGLKRQLELYRQVMTDMNITDEERASARKKYSETLISISDNETEREIKNKELTTEAYRQQINYIQDIASEIGGILGSVADGWEASAQAQLDSGKITEEEYNREVERVRGLKVAEAIMNTISGALGAYMQASSSYPAPYGQILGGIAAASVAASGWAQIQSLKSANSGTTVTTSYTQPKVSDYNPNYTRVLTTSDDTAYLTKAVESANISVSVTDINEVQNRVKVRDNESTF